MRLEGLGRAFPEHEAAQRAGPVAGGRAIGQDLLDRPDVGLGPVVLAVSYTLLGASIAVYAVGRVKGESKVSHTGMDMLRSLAISEAMVQTTRTAAELLAEPEHLNAAAYAALAVRPYPWTLPFDLWTEIWSVSSAGSKRNSPVVQDVRT